MMFDQDYVFYTTTIIVLRQKVVFLCMVDGLRVDATSVAEERTTSREGETAKATMLFLAQPQSPAGSRHGFRLRCNIGGFFTMA